MNKQLTVEIKPRLPLVPDAFGAAILSEIKSFGISTIQGVEVIKVYKADGDLNQKDKDRLKDELFLEPLWQKEVAFDSQSLKNKKIIEISLKPGVTNTEIDSIISAAKDLSINLFWAQSDRKIILAGTPTEAELDLIIDKILMNKTIEVVIKGRKKSPAKFFSKPKIRKIKLREMKDSELIQLSQERLLYLSVAEMKAVQKYFIEAGREPTDCELEAIAQTWSEHCFHKTFKSPIKIDGKLRLSFMERIKLATRDINHKDCLVTFSDNAGIVSLDETYAFCAKCETHNSPSALEPYGGAMTGSGGVFRDIAGAGLGAKNIAASDIFCFGAPTMKLEDVPPGCLHPLRIMKKCVDGVRYYGNCMGIPTINGSVSFDPDFRAKPVVLVGAFGIIPKKFVFKKKIVRGDLIVSVGGKTGRDGIHGATFSSGEMTKDTESRASSAVQIGNPIEEKKMFDALLIARDTGIIKNVADCGGGGYSSSIGEMGKDMGVWVDLARVPLKYKGLDPWEIWLSESQERMVIAISPKKLKKLKAICGKFNTSFTVLGRFTGKKKLELYFGKKMVADLSMNFLFNGIPKRVLEGEHKKQLSINNYQLTIKKKKNYNSIFKKILSNLNVASKEEIVRRYDHEVQGRLALKPYLGVNYDGPSDSAIVKPLFGSKKGLVFGHGLAVSVAKLDPYWAAAAAVDEAIRNVVAGGADPSKIFLLDNFIFPYPIKDVLGDLDQSVDGICDAAKSYATPFISGKDSLSGTYKSQNLEIRVPPTVIISSVGVTDDINKTVSSDFKRSGNCIYLLGETLPQLGGSIFSQESGNGFTDVPRIDFKKNLLLYQKLYQLIKNGLISSCHDISEGGLAVTLSEMCFGGNFGANISLEKVINDRSGFEAILFGESSGRFVIEVEKAKVKRFERLFASIPYASIGQVENTNEIKINDQKKVVIGQDLKRLKNIWQKSFKKYF